MIASDRAAQRWHFVVDNLDTHRSESLVRWVARESGLELELGKKGKWGILANRESRAAFLSEPSHRIVFHYTPKHASWMNQVEIWLSILVRKLLQRGSFKSVTDLKQKVWDFIDYYNRTMAKPFKWTYQGKVLVAWTVGLFTPTCTSWVDGRGVRLFPGWLGPRSLAGKPLAGFYATPIRRIPVLCGTVVHVLR